MHVAALAKWNIYNEYRKYANGSSVIGCWNLRHDVNFVLMK